MKVPTNRYGAAVSVVGAAFLEGALSASGMNLTPGVTRMSRSIYELHMTIFYICVVIGIFVFGMLFYSIFKYRRSLGHEAKPFYENVWIEIGWTLIPAIILVSMAIPATRVLLQMDNTEDSDYTIKITGKQWYWVYEYLHENVRFESHLSTPEEQIQGLDMKGANYLLEVDKPLVLPVGKKIRLLTTSDNVIHSWWVPALGFKKDANPGFINEMWTIIEQPGIYRGQCAELCGARHGFMPIVLDVKPWTEFQTWLLKQKAEIPVEGASATP